MIASAVLVATVAAPLAQAPIDSLRSLRAYQPSLTQLTMTRELRLGKPAKAVTPKPRSGEGGLTYPTT